MRTIFFIILFISFEAKAELSTSRQKQLDSIVTNIDKDRLRNLDSLHITLHQKGINDEERVFLFYGLFATHYKYDVKRYKSGQRTEFTPFYTAYRKSGVCRDFADLFKELCDRSNIPCCVAIGRVKLTFLNDVNDFFHLRLKKANHAWNLVKYNDSWHLMDPTWSVVSRTEKYYGKDENGRKKYLGKVKIPSRNYYNTESELFYKKRKAIHPAFYKCEKVYTLKTVGKKEKRKELIDGAYCYSSTLDSLSSNPYYQFSKNFLHEVSLYSKDNYLNRKLNYYWLFLDLKRSKFDQLTVQSCKEHLSQFQSLLTFIKNELSIDYSAQFKLHTIAVNKEIEKLKRKATS